MGFNSGFDLDFYSPVPFVDYYSSNGVRYDLFGRNLQVPIDLTNYVTPINPPYTPDNYNPNPAPVVQNNYPQINRSTFTRHTLNTRRTLSKQASKVKVKYKNTSAYKTHTRGLRGGYIQNLYAKQGHKTHKKVKPNGIDILDTIFGIIGNISFKSFGGKLASLFFFTGSVLTGIIVAITKVGKFFRKISQKKNAWKSLGISILYFAATALITSILVAAFTAILNASPLALIPFAPEIMGAAAGIYVANIISNQISKGLIKKYG